VHTDPVTIPERGRSVTTTSASAATDLWRLSATELAAAIRLREVSVREVVDAHLRRIDAVNPAVNAIVIRLDEQALDAAGRADRTTIAGDELPPFHGVPFTIKENIDVVGTPTTQGAQALINANPTRDAPVVERMRAVGAIPIGRTNLPTYAIRWRTDSELWGQTINPWDRTRTPGASSGGEAVALATGMSLLGSGTTPSARCAGPPNAAGSPR